MKTLKILLTLSIISVFAIGNVNAQSTSVKEIDTPLAVFIPCAGELAVGIITLHVVLTYNKKGNLIKEHFQPMGGELVGEITGTVYHPTGVTQTKGFEPYSYINLFHMVGPGIQFFVRQVFHYVILPDGDVKVVVDKYEVICK